MVYKIISFKEQIVFGGPTDSRLDYGLELYGKPESNQKPIPAPRSKQVDSRILNYFEKYFGLGPKEIKQRSQTVDRSKVFVDIRNDDLLRLSAHISRANLSGFEGFHDTVMANIISNLLDKAWFSDEIGIFAHIKSELFEECDSLWNSYEIRINKLMDRVTSLSKDNPGPVIVLSGYDVHATKSLFYWKNNKIMFQSINVGENCKAVAEIDRSTERDARGAKLFFYEYDLGPGSAATSSIRTLVEYLVSSKTQPYETQYKHLESYLNKHIYKTLVTSQSFRMQMKGYCTWESLLNSMIRVAEIKGEPKSWRAIDAREFIVQSFESNLMKLLEFELVRRMYNPKRGDSTIDEVVLDNIFWRREELELIYGGAIEMAEHKIYKLPKEDAIRKLGSKVGDFILNQYLGDTNITIFMRGYSDLCHEASFKKGHMNVTLLRVDFEEKNERHGDTGSLIKKLFIENMENHLSYINSLIKGHGNLFMDSGHLYFKDINGAAFKLDKENPLEYNTNILTLHLASGGSMSILTSSSIEFNQMLEDISKYFSQDYSIRSSNSRLGHLVLTVRDKLGRVDEYLLDKELPYQHQDGKQISFIFEDESRISLPMTREPVNLSFRDGCMVFKGFDQRAFTLNKENPFKYHTNIFVLHLDSGHDMPILTLKNIQLNQVLKEISYYFSQDFSVRPSNSRLGHLVLTVKDQFGRVDDYLLDKHFPYMYQYGQPISFLLEGKSRIPLMTIEDINQHLAPLGRKIRSSESYPRHLVLEVTDDVGCVTKYLLDPQCPYSIDPVNKKICFHSSTKNEFMFGRQLDIDFNSSVA